MASRAARRKSAADAIDLTSHSPSKVTRGDCCWRGWGCVLGNQNKLESEI